jgi:hypothetical protein
MIVLTISRISLTDFDRKCAGESMERHCSLLSAVEKLVLHLTRYISWVEKQDEVL